MENKQYLEEKSRDQNFFAPHFANWTPLYEVVGARLHRRDTQLAADSPWSMWNPLIKRISMGETEGACRFRWKPQSGNIGSTRASVFQ